MDSIVLLGHGSHLNPNTSATVHAHADRMADQAGDVHVTAGFWKEEPAVADVGRTVPPGDCYIVPVFISEGYFTEQVIPRELGLGSAWPGSWTAVDGDIVCADRSDGAGTWWYCRPVGTHESMADVIVSRAESVTGREDVGSGTALAVIGHGTERNPRSASVIQRHAETIRRRDRFAEVITLFLDESPYVADLTDHITVDEVVVVPLFIANGYHTTEDIPASLGITADDGTWPVPAIADGRQVWYAGAVGTEPLIAEVAATLARTAGAAIGPIP